MTESKYSRLLADPKEYEQNMKIYQDFGSQFVYEDFTMHIDIESLILLLHKMDQKIRDLTYDIRDLESRIDALEYVTDTTAFYE